MSFTFTKSGPPLADTNADGSRWYVHPITGERFISVTTVLSSITKFGLPDWAAKLSSVAALDHLEWLQACSALDTCNSFGDDACGNCKACAIKWLSDRHNQVRDEAGLLGKKLHDAAEEETLFGPGAHIDDDVKPFFDQYKRWCADVQPTFLASEMTVISRKWGYAGTLDTILSMGNPPKKLAHLKDKPVCGDWKTGKNVGITNGWQVTAYTLADAVLLKDGTELPMPAIEGGLIVHIRPDKVQTREVYPTAANHQFFIHMVAVVEGLGLGLNSVLSRPITLADAE